MTPKETLEKFDAPEVYFRLPGPTEGLQLFLRYLCFTHESVPQNAVLLVHGMPLPSALSIVWMDVRCAISYVMQGSQDPPFGHPEEIRQQIDCATRFICAQPAASKISVIAHSRGTVGTRFSRSAIRTGS